MLLAAVVPHRTLLADEAEIRYCFNDWAPYATMEGQNARGVSIDILREATARAGMTAKFFKMPWNRCLEMVRGGEIDVVIDAADRSEFIQGPTSYASYTNTFWVRDDFPTDRLDFGALQGKTIGLIDGYKYPDGLWADLRKADMKIEYSVDDGTNIGKLAFVRVDAIIGDFVSTLEFAEDGGLKLKALSPTHSADRLYPSFNSNLGELQSRIDAALAAMRTDGSIDRIYRRHLGKSFDGINPE